MKVAVKVRAAADDGFQLGARLPREGESACDIAPTLESVVA
jgi:hypothetical protein